MNVYKENIQYLRLPDGAINTMKSNYRGILVKRE
tara:strand:- start:1740 stop:1841 length:102 start_codon:yes stop_codon:yes gene_type:complete